MYLKQYVDQDAHLRVTRCGVKKMPVRGGMLDYLWVPAALIFGVGDIVTTRLALSLGAVESNEIVRFLIDEFGGNLWAFVILKTVILLVLLFLSFAALGKFRWVMPAFLCCSGAFLLLYNLSAISGLLF